MAGEKSKTSELATKNSDVKVDAGDLPASFETLVSLIRSEQAPY